MSMYGEPYRRPRHAAASFLWPLLFLLLLIGVLFWRFWPHGSPADLTVETREVSNRTGPLWPDEEKTIDLFRKVSPSVVHVTNVAEVGSGFSMHAQEEARGTGSGFIWSDEGVIVTNYHVVKDADAVQVVLADKQRSTFTARDWVSYPAKDTAVVWIDAPKRKLSPIRLGSSGDLKVGQRTFAIGNPFGLDQTLTSGIVSALGREIQSATNRPIRGVIQTSSAINPGNSGGPLLDSDGRLIGMNTAILSPSGAFAGIGFAIPVDDIRQSVPRLIEELKKSPRGTHPQITPPQLGVQIADQDLAQELGVTEGALIIRVLPNSPAERAGLRATTSRGPSGQIQLGDILVGIDGEKVHTASDVHSQLEQHKNGDTVTLTILRDGKRQDVTITLGPAE
ncbi:MAG TPA: trypsin-like peptidase domain-containing protein [Gemmataceae bacterium]|jgi:S1-C subfamily serine protease|nr:trypsin-like peptidase domain-containing protein [Gemmataceae bacterium]